MGMQTLEGLRSGIYQSTKLLRLLSCGLSEIPREVLVLADSLEILDLSGNPLSQLPEDFGRLHKLKIVFFSDCNFSVFPQQLAQCGSLEMVAFRSNGMSVVPENAFPPQLRWLILTNNSIESLPRSIGQCHRLQKVMLAGNQLTALPDEMANCKKLGLLRISANDITGVPPWLFSLPELAFLAFSGNPCAPSSPEVSNTNLAEIPWAELSVSEVLGEGASGIISRGIWKGKDGQQDKPVAIKLFKGDVTSDGSPLDEMNACIAAGSHPNLIDPIGRIHGHPGGKPGLVLQLIPPHYTNLGLPPTLQSCTRDSFPPNTVFSAAKCKAILRSIASAAAHHHARGIAHGDIYAHNILIDDAGHALLGDFGAATICGKSHPIERLEVLAFGHLVQDLMGLLDCEEAAEFVDNLKRLHDRCTKAVVTERPVFSDVYWVVDGL